MLLICTASSGHNRALANRISELADTLEMANTVLDLTVVDLPLYTPVRDDAGRPSALDEIEPAFESAAGFVFCAPEYNGSIPPTLTRSGGGGQKVLVAMRLQMSHLGGNVVGREIQTSASKALRDESVLSILGQLSSGMAS
jgi:chromate reductase